LKARLIEWRELAPDVRHFLFEAAEPVTATPGQFFSFTAEIEGKAITRAYTLVAPAKGRRFELCLNRVPGGRLSPWLFGLQPGEEAECKGPYGGFTLRGGSDVVMVAAGAGVAPFRAMLLDILPRQREHRYILILGTRHRQGLLYRDEFEALAHPYPNFTFWPVLSRPDVHWRGRSGHVQPHVWEAVGDRRDLDVYLCGLKCMVDDVRTQLKAAGFDRKRIIYEKYD
jgi:CDP-4-dehydro-6-deoxyglucose reductase